MITRIVALPIMTNHSFFGSKRSQRVSQRWRFLSRASRWSGEFKSYSVQNFNQGPNVLVEAFAIQTLESACEKKSCIEDIVVLGSFDVSTLVVSLLEKRWPILALMPTSLRSTFFVNVPEVIVSCLPGSTALTLLPLLEDSYQIYVKVIGITSRIKCLSVGGHNGLFVNVNMLPSM